MQSARTVRSDEARGNLRDARHRVMSVASVQRQLAASSVGEVALRPYLTQLCESIGASMIFDHDRLALNVTADATTVGANVSVSIGLIVTELVINALKHAFPDQRHGTIAVDCSATGAAWTLSVGDDGVGMPVAPQRATTGLGTTIVTALAKQLRAEISVKPANPGTTVTVAHSALQGVNDDAAAPIETAG